MSKPVDPQPQEASRMNNGKRVFAVVSSAFYRGVLEAYFKFLRKEELEVRGTGAGARNAIAQYVPDLIIVDLDADRDMLELLEGIRNQDNLKGIPLVALSDNAVLQERALSSADYFIHKPFKVRDLGDIVERLLAKKGEGS